MTRGSMSVALATALGACVGTLSALEISTRFAYGSYMWCFGAVLGGIVAYVAIDFRHFCAGVARSYHRTIAWRPLAPYWRTFRMSFLGVLSMCHTSMVGVVALLYGMSFFEKGVAIATEFPATDWVAVASYLGRAYLIALAFAIFFSFLLALRLTARGDTTYKEYRSLLRRMYRTGWEQFAYYNPLSVAWIIIYSSISGPRWTIQNAPRLALLATQKLKAAAVFASRFVAQAFVFVHSQRRTICFVDATLGAAIGYSCGSVVVGTVAGVVFGLLNYEIISVRVLKLAPASIK